MDNVDIKIINALVANSRASTTSIADTLKISNVATQQRIKKLEQSGVIKKYTTVVDFSLLEFKTIAYLGIFLEKAKNYAEVIAEMEKVPNVLEAHFTTGTYSIFAKIFARDNIHLMETLSNHIQNIDGIARTETFISLQEGINKSIELEMLEK